MNYFSIDKIPQFSDCSPYISLDFPNNDDQKVRNGRCWNYEDWRRQKSEEYQSKRLEKSVAE